MMTIFNNVFKHIGKPCARNSLIVICMTLGGLQAHGADSVEGKPKQYGMNDVIELHKLSVEDAERRLGPSAFPVAVMLNDLAKIYKNVGRYDEAEVTLKRVLAITLQHYAQDHPNVVAAVENLAEVYQSQGKMDKLQELRSRYSSTK
jgi:tetratricopeptide (TPR) repeat protein